MGLKFLGREPLESSAPHGLDLPLPQCDSGRDDCLIIMGEVDGGMATLRPDSFVGASRAPGGLGSCREVMHKKACDVLKSFPGLQ